MIGPEPWFMEWVDIGEGGWKIRDDAPEEAKKAFEEHMSESGIWLDGKKV